MAGLSARFGLLVALLGSLLGAAPHGAGPHCGPAEPGVQASHHGPRSQGHHQAPANDTESAGQCPHCPPADCRRHAECASTLDLTVPVVLPTAHGPVPPVLVGRPPLRTASLAVAPPTPPPQRLS